VCWSYLSEPFYRILFILYLGFVLMINLFHLQAYNDCVYVATGWFTKIMFPKLQIFMSALWNRAVHYIFCVVISMYLRYFFLDLSLRAQIGCLPYFHTWYGPAANLECTCKMCCMWLAANGHKIAILVSSHNFVGPISTKLSDVSKIERKNLLKTDTLLR